MPVPDGSKSGNADAAIDFDDNNTDDINSSMTFSIHKCAQLNPGNVLIIEFEGRGDATPPLAEVMSCIPLQPYLSQRRVWWVVATVYRFRSLFMLFV